MARVCRIIVRGFALAYGLALLLFLIGAFGWFGSPQGPLAGVFLILLGLPWILLLDTVPESRQTVLAAAAPLVNLATLNSLCARLNRQGRS